MVKYYFEKFLSGSNVVVLRLTARGHISCIEHGKRVPNGTQLGFRLSESHRYSLPQRHSIAIKSYDPCHDDGICHLKCVLFFENCFGCLINSSYHKSVLQCKRDDVIC